MSLFKHVCKSIFSIFWTRYMEYADIILIYVYKKSQCKYLGFKSIYKAYWGFTSVCSTSLYMQVNWNPSLYLMFVWSLSEDVTVIKSGF